MKQYLDIVRNVLDNGIDKTPVRKDAEGNFIPVDGGVKTIGLPLITFEHDMAEGFPLLTTKKMAKKTMAVELEGFIKGITSKSWYEERGCKIWSEWANPKAVEQLMKNKHPDNFPESWDAAWPHIKDMQLKCNDLGPIYGYQWRRFGECYDEDDNGPMEGYDQFASIVETLRNNPMDRRMVCSAWNPNHLSRMGLAACHVMFNVVVYGDTLNLGWYQRSCDLMLGVPFNIASYGLLLTLLAKDAGLRPGKLMSVLADCHIYENQIEGAKAQLTRTPKPLPDIEVGNPTPYVSRIGTQDVRAIPPFDIFKWTHEHTWFINYNPDTTPLDFGAVAV